jgi:hypothetical protein
MTRPYALLSTVSAVPFASVPPVAGFAPVPSGDPAKAAAVAAGVGTQIAMPSQSSEDITKRSLDSAAMLDYWNLTDALIEGYAAVKAGGETWLPRFDKEPQSRYTMRLKLTKFTNVYGDIIENLSSKPFEQEVSLIADEDKTIPEPLLQFLENVDGSGKNMTVFASNVFFNGINSAVDWIMVDSAKPTTDAEGNPVQLTIEQARERGIRPYWTRVLGRNVFDAQSVMEGADEKLSYIKIYEPGSPDHIREFERIGSIVYWRLWRKLPDTSYTQVEGGTLSIDEIPLYPFATGRRDGKRFKWFPPMRSAADLQIELYQEESALKFLKKLAAYPMLTGNGVKPKLGVDGKPEELAVGPGVVLYAPTDGDGNTASWSFVEPSAQTMTFLAADVKETIMQLRELGRMPLTAQSGNLTVVTAAAAAGKAKSAVGAWAYALKDALENAMVGTCKFLNIGADVYDPQVQVYTEFDEFTDDTENDILSADRDRGDLSRETLWHERKRRGVYGPEFDPETETERLLSEVPSDDGEDTIDPEGNV